MPIVAVFEGGLTQDDYEQVVQRLAGKPRMESTSDWPEGGLLSHAAGQGPDGFRVVDVWDSEESFRKFGETLVPILQEVGVDVEPEVYPTYAFVTA